MSLTDSRLVLVSSSSEFGDRLDLPFHPRFRWVVSRVQRESLRLTRLRAPLANTGGVVHDLFGVDEGRLPISILRPSTWLNIS